MQNSSSKIAILAYGSLTLCLLSPYYDEPLKIKEAFEITDLEIWTGFYAITDKEHPQKARVCLQAIAPQTTKAALTPLYHALHKENSLDLAIENFMKREGMNCPSQVAVIQNSENTFTSQYSAQCFDDEHIKQIENWLMNKGYDVALLAQFEPRHDHLETTSFLKSCPNIQKRTLDYFYRLPESTQKLHEDFFKELGLIEP